MKLVLIPRGTFTMGSPKAETGREASEGPQHEVEITRPFYLGSYPVTQAEYRKVMGSNPSYFSATGGGKDKVAGDTGRFPVESVSWVDATRFCARLSALAKEKAAGRVYRLPTEAEWEYACRAGTTTPFHFGKSASSRQANFDGEQPSGGAAGGPFLLRTCKVGSYKANDFGLFDMHGNVWQWCQDWYKKDYYKESPKEDPKGPYRGVARLLRGGCWGDPGSSCRAGRRGWFDPREGSADIGFRVACVVHRTP
jgi:formylglycine-generating enzyme required for sulfatase activity